jgi:transcription initiation factor IIE alpha subunit
MSKTEQIIKTIHEEYGMLYIFENSEELMNEFKISRIDYNNLLNALRNNKKIPKKHNKKDLLYKNYIYYTFEFKGVKYNAIQHFINN